MNRTVFTRAGVVLALVSPLFLLTPALASASSLAAAPAPCDVMGTPFLTLTQSVTEPDSGAHGDWANDSFTENVSVWQVTDSSGTFFCAIGTTTNATFVTTGPNSPGAGVALSSGITGTFAGGETWIFPAGTATTTSATTLAATADNLPSDGQFNNWQSQVFNAAGQGVDASTYSFTYVVDASSTDTWTNADSASNPPNGSSGDITNTGITSSTVYVDASTGNDTNIGSSAAPFKTIQAAVNAVAVSGTVDVKAGTYTENVTINNPVTLAGESGAKLVVVDGAQNNGIVVSANNVTVQGLDIEGPANSSYTTYAWGSNITRGIMVVNGVTGFNITNNTIANLRNDILIDGRNTGSVTHNVIDNSKSGISIQYTDAGAGNTEGYAVTVSGNTQGTYGNDWGVNVHLNGHTDGAGNASFSTSQKIAADAPLAVQDALIANSVANSGWTVQDQGYSTSNRTAVTVNTSGTLTAQGDPLGPISTIQAGIDAVTHNGVVNVKNGVYSGSLSITKNGIQVLGETEGGVTVNENASNSFGQGVSVDHSTGVSLSNMTFTVPVAAPISYAFQAYKADGLTLSNLSFTGPGKTSTHIGGVDVNTTNNVTENNISSTGFYKNGFSFTAAYASTDTSADGITLNGISSTNNGWTGISFYTVGNDKSTNTPVSVGGHGSFANVQFIGSNIISGNGEGLFIEGDSDANHIASSTAPVHTVTSDGTKLNISTTAFSGNTIDVENYQTAGITAISATFNGILGRNMTNPQRTTEDSLIVDSKDNSNLGTVTFSTVGVASTTGPSNTSLVGTSTESGSVTVTVEIPANTTIAGDSTWDGVVNAPTATTASVTVSGFTTTVTSAVTIGSSQSDLTFDKGVRLSFTGEAGQHIGWYNHAGTFTEITDTCSADTQTVGDALAAAGSCKIDVSGNLIVWTKHFSTFVTYTQTQSGGGGNGGGGGGGGGVAGSYGQVSNGYGGYVTLGTTGTGVGTGVAFNSGSTGGQVLGAAAYNFASNLTVGSTGDDVTQLQAILIAEGDLAIAAPTGYFGPLTKAAVVKYQTAHGVSPQSGYVGPLTRGVLNLGSTSSIEVTSSTSSLSVPQIQAILSLLQSFGSDMATMLSVKASLGGH